MGRTENGGVNVMPDQLFLQIRIIDSPHSIFVLNHRIEDNLPSVILNRVGKTDIGR